MYKFIIELKMLGIFPFASVILNALYNTENVFLRTVSSCHSYFSWPSY